MKKDKKYEAGKPASKPEKKKTWKIVLIVLLIVLLIAGITVLIVYHHQKTVSNSDNVFSAYTDTYNDSKDGSKTTEEDLGDPSEDEEQASRDAAREKAEYAKKPDYYKDPDGTPAFIDGVAKFTISTVSSKPDYYYFEDGKWNRHYTGFADEALSGNYDYYVKNGIVDHNFTGVKNDGSYYWYIKNGVLQHDYCGKITYKGKTYNFFNGFALDYERN